MTSYGEAVRGREWAREWKAYEKKNANARRRYNQDKRTIDWRYDPTMAGVGSKSPSEQ